MDVEELVAHCNKVAMDELRKGNHEESLHLLKTAEKSLSDLPNTSENQRLIGITLNNIGCYFKHQGNFDSALHYLKIAIKNTGSSLDDQINKAGTYLNICAIKSQWGDHHSALENAQRALEILAEKFKSSRRSRVLITTLVVAFYNIGIEYEHLDQTDAANQNYRNGWEIATENLPANHELVHKMHKCIQDTSMGSRGVQSHNQSSFKIRPGTAKRPCTAKRPTQRSRQILGGPRGRSAQKSLKSPNNSYLMQTTSTLHKPSYQPSFHTRSTGRSPINMNRTGSNLLIKPPERPRSYRPAARVRPMTGKRFRTKLRKPSENEVAVAAARPVSMLENTELQALVTTVANIQGRIQNIEATLNKPTKENLTKEHRSAIMIQSNWRGYIARKYLEPHRAGLKAYRAISELEDIRKTIYDPERQNNAKKISEIRQLIGTLRRNKVERDLKLRFDRQSIE